MKIINYVNSSMPLTSSEISDLGLIEMARIKENRDFFPRELYSFFSDFAGPMKLLEASFENANSNRSLNEDIKVILKLNLQNNTGRNIGCFFRFEVCANIFLKRIYLPTKGSSYNFMFSIPKPGTYYPTISALDEEGGFFLHKKRATQLVIIDS